MGADGRRSRPGKRGRHRHLPTLLVVLALVLVQAAWRLAPDRHRIEHVATPVGPIPSRSDQRYVVLSDRLVLLIPFGGSSQNAVPRLLDVATGKSEPMPQLRKWIGARGTLSRTELLLSPTGEWYLHVRRGGPGSRATLIHRSGRPTYSFPSRGEHTYSAAWTADGAEWVEFVGQAFMELNNQPVQAYVHRTASPDARVGLRDIDLPPTVHTYPEALVPLPGGRVAGTVIDGDSLDLVTFSVGYVGAATPSGQPPLPVPDISIPQALQVSPDGKHLAWLCSTTPRRSALTEFIDRWLAWLRPDGPSGSSIWISGLDGSGLHEVVSTPSPINDFAWCADGKRLWVVYRKALWTVPTD